MKRSEFEQTREGRREPDDPADLKMVAVLLGAAVLVAIVTVGRPVFDFLAHGGALMP